MSLSVLSQGQLTADPVRRESKSGKPFVTVQIRVATEDESMLLSVICFDAAACCKLERLKKGDAVAVSGRAKPTTWVGRDGETQRGLSVVAGAVLSVYEARKRRNAASSTEDDLPDAKPEPGIRGDRGSCRRRHGGDIRGSRPGLRRNASR